MKKNRIDKVIEEPSCPPTELLINFEEVDRKHSLVLFEFDLENNTDTGVESLSEETVHEFFPDFDVKEGKGYVIESF